MPMSFISLNNHPPLNVTIRGKDIQVNGHKIEADILKISNNQYHILYQNKSYHACLVRDQNNPNTIRIKINNQEFLAQLTDPFRSFFAESKSEKKHSKSTAPLISPMPGLIVKVFIQEGMEVRTGDPLLVLKAMKMENVIKAPQHGRVLSVKVTEGQSVEKGQALIQFA
jgi:biotin carboxyl carrier protein